MQEFCFALSSHIFSIAGKDFDLVVVVHSFPLYELILIGLVLHLEFLVSLASLLTSVSILICFPMLFDPWQSCMAVMAHITLRISFPLSNVFLM